MSKSIIYEVEIKRSNGGTFIDGHFWWTVNVVIDGDSDYDYRSFGWARSIDKGKHKALKAIRRTDKYIQGNSFGIKFATSGTLNEIEKDLL